MKVAIVGTYPAETYKKFEEHFAGNPEIEVVEIDTQEKFDALTEADAIILRIFKMPKEVVARIKGLKVLTRLMWRKQENAGSVSATHREQTLMRSQNLPLH